MWFSPAIGLWMWHCLCRRAARNFTKEDGGWCQVICELQAELHTSLYFLQWIYMVCCINNISVGNHMVYHSPKDPPPPLHNLPADRVVAHRLVGKIYTTYKSTVFWDDMWAWYILHNTTHSLWSGYLQTDLVYTSLLSLHCMVSCLWKANVVTPFGLIGSPRTGFSWAGKCFRFVLTVPEQ